ncbi:DUF3016 domain-containing protein [Dyella monticola]|uniref:DUF3016 domain-containing protein n=1 Tax=Dyella monticola TaxID=1927958 RepID=A0A370WUI8_9GAMM|nr:DUF3016 domain-containing protein [Dyella monticola]RDS79686.1 DUF3016 domain-containing protein [Dyella monticola]
MNRRIVLHALLATLALLQLPAMATTAPPPNVSVSYDHPEQFTETRKVLALAPSLAHDDYLQTLKRYIDDRASKIVPAGDHLDIVVTDVERAGTFEPWRGPELRNVRVIKSMYPPHIDLRFRLLDTHGQVIREGARKLRDPFFRADAASEWDIDSLRYEKLLIDRWLKKGPEQL